MNKEPVPFNLNSYVAFDGTSIRDIIVNRLNQGKVFTDQNYQGSNLSGFIDIISYTFNTLLYYLNKTASESMFTEAQLYENMNRIVKLLNYKPVGRMGQNVSFDLTANQNLPKGNYYIPRYSYIQIGGTFFSTNQDIAFSKLVDETATISDISNNYLLYQGLFQEYPIYTAAGIENEVLFLSLNEATYVDHFNIFVYVKPKNKNKWEKWENVSDLFLYKSNDTVYSTRFNHNLNYEIQFGDGVNGVKLNEGDQVAIYYLKIDKNAAEISPNALSQGKLVGFNSVQYAQIIKDTTYNISNKLDQYQLGYLILDNQYPSNPYTDYETVESIRKNAPTGFKSQNKLITTDDYVSFINTNFNNIVSNTTVVNNDDYLNGHLKYLYDIGLNSPQTDNQVLFNQVKFSTSCNFNNIYIYTVPKNDLQDYTSPPQKELIVNKIRPIKTATSNIVVMDPVYMYIDFYAKSPLTSPTVSDLDKSTLMITKSKTTKRSDSSIISDIKSLFTSLFNSEKSELGQLIDLYQLNSNILEIDGVQSVRTYRSDTNTYINGISILMWNYLYPSQDSNVYTQNINLKYFQYPVFNNVNSIENRIKIENQTGYIVSADF